MSLGDTLNHRQWNLSLSDTNALKGIALILLLCHHLFYIQDGSYNDILVFGKYPLVRNLDWPARFAWPYLFFCPVMAWR